MTLVKTLRSSSALKSTVWLTAIFRLLAVGLAGLYTWAAATSHSMNADGISYLDMGDAFWRGDWPAAFNSPWSPLYAWILGGVLRLFAPPMPLEFPLVHATNFLIFLFALLCFEFFWRELLHYHRQRTAATDSTATCQQWPDWSWWAIGYLLFISATLILIELWAVTPDLLMSAFLYLAAGLVLRLRCGERRWRTFLLLGLALGLGYLAKEIMLPVSLLLLALTFFAAGPARTAAPRLLVAGLCFLAVFLPYDLIATAVRGDATFGGAATFTYAKHVNGIPFAHWQGETPGSGTPLHPTRRILDHPPIYEFGTPIPGTYPVSYNPAYWNAGLQAHFDLRQQFDALVSSTLFYFDVFFNHYGALLFGALLLHWLGRHRPDRPTTRLARWSLALAALAVFAFYGAVLVTGRYVGAFVLLFWGDVLANVRLPAQEHSRRLLPAVSAIIVIFLLVQLAAFTLEGYATLNPPGPAAPAATLQDRPPRWPGEVAQALHQAGITAGDPVAVIGYGFDSFWARLARVQIIAELVDADALPFWNGDPALQARVIDAFATTGARVIVAEHVPHYASLSGWQQINDTNYYYYLLD